MRTLDHERVVTLSADDLASMLDAMQQLSEAIITRHGNTAVSHAGQVDAIIEQLRAKFDL